MTKAMRELLDKRSQAKAKATELCAKDNASLAEIEAATEELKTINAQITLLEMEEANDKAEFNGSPLAGMPEDRSEDELYNEAFYNAVRGKNLTESEASILESRGALTSSTGEDGGLLIPTDEQNEINELKRQMDSLEQYVNVEPVTTTAGTRVLEKDADSTPFTEFVEGEDVPNAASPQFVSVAYAIKDRGGFLPIPNNLLNDAKANLKGYLRKWLAKKQVATRNSLILAKLATWAKTPIAGFDDLKKVLNVTLDPAIKNNALIFTNQDGFDKLDTIKDSTGNYILKPDVTDPSKKKVEGKLVVVLSNKTLATRDDAGTLKAPIIIGDLKEAITLFDRQQMSVLTTNVGGDAFKKNRTDMRAITREDVQSVDTKAVVYGEIIVG